MKVFLKILKVLGAFLATLITPLLVAALMLAPVANTVSSVFTGDFVGNIVSNIDIKEMVNSNEAFKESLEKAEIDPEQIDVILKSDAFGEVVELYTEDLTEILAGNRDESEFTADVLKEIVSDNIDEVVGAFKKYVPETEDMTDAEIEEEILKGLDESGEHLIEMLPKAEDMKDMASEISGDFDIGSTIKFMQKSLMPIVYGVIAGLALLIFLFRIHKFNGLLWDGIIFTGCSVLMFVAALGLKSAVIALDENVMQGIADTLSPFISSLTGMFLPFAIAYAVIGVLFIGGFIALCVLRRTKQKKLALAAATAVEAPETEQAALADATEEKTAEETVDAPADEEAAPEEEKAEEAEKTEEAEVK